MNASAVLPVRLGLVCITNSDAIRFRTITRTRLLQFPETERPPILHAIYQDNLRRVWAGWFLCRAGHRHVPPVFPSAAFRR